MATKIQDIKAVNWQLSSERIGEVVEGISDIRQCIGTILKTTKGSDPLRPLFGSDIWQYVDKPVNTAAPNIAYEILDALGKWETRIIIKDLQYETRIARIDFVLTCMLLESGEVTQVLFYIDRQKQISPPAIGRAFSNGFDLGFS